jgi:hypothetical protein
VSASFAEEISSGKTVFEVIYPAFAPTLIVELALIFLPPCVFAFRLRACQEKGLSDYMVFATRYVNDFENKWLNASTSRRILCWAQNDARARRSGRSHATSTKKRAIMPAH